MADKEDELDFTDKYNTPLTQPQEDQFQGWVARQSKLPLGPNGETRDVSKDLYDYDLRGWWQANNGPDLTGGHLTDNWKKPNHMTFSTGSIYHGVDGNEGGAWGKPKRPNALWTFRPGKTNLENYSADEMQDYFGRVEQGKSEVILPSAGR